MSGRGRSGPITNPAAADGTAGAVVPDARDASIRHSTVPQVILNQ